MGYYKLKCGCTIKLIKNKDNQYQMTMIRHCPQHFDSWQAFPDKCLKIHPKSYGAKQLSKLEVSIVKLQEN